MWNRFVDSDKLATDVIKSAEKIGLADALSEPASSLSYGMQRQLEVGLAMAADPKLLLLDEPTAGMSPEETKLMLALVASLPVSLTVVIIEHDMDVVFQIAQQVTVLDDGAVLFEGTPDAVRHSDVVRARYLKRAK
jgi:branched-chain amino acid transport system ATP-binding protein